MTSKLGIPMDQRFVTNSRPSKQKKTTSAFALAAWFEIRLARGIIISD